MKNLFTFFLFLSMAVHLGANNITVDNLSLTGKNATDHCTLVQFDISWENSWRTSSAPNNRDAAWVFIKYRVPASSGGDGFWHHAWLNNTGHTVPTGSAIDVGMQTPGSNFNAATNPGVGVFLFRSADGAGTFTKTGVQLRWNYGNNFKTGSTPIGDNDIVDFQVLAIEMVYVPSGTFTVGSGGTESGSFTNGSWESGATTSLSISSESDLTIAHSTGNLWGTSVSGDNTIGDPGTLAAAFPKGFDAFYCMKYEISQQQYVDFLNTLTQTQATERKFDKPSPNYRYEITGSTVGNYVTAYPYAACNHLSWMDGAAYTDWAGLRPMTELEFEKACRGTATPVAGEFAWGNTTATSAKNITNGGAINETTSTSDANAVFYDLTYAQAGPMRAGVFAIGSATRVQAGSTYYGIMEMSGNLWERAVTVGNATGRAFTGVHGNGTLSAAGYADISTWPGYVTSEVTGATGSGLRGGSFTDDWMGVSDRTRGALDFSERYRNDGFRAVRTKALAIGDLYKGGIVAYILQSGDPGYIATVQKGLIAANTDQGTLVLWWNGTNTTTGATGTALGTGSANTTAIISSQGNTGSYAAKICRDYAGGGYNDWFLPSQDELEKLYLNRAAIGMTSNDPNYAYWSSTEYNASSAWSMDFIHGNENLRAKTWTFYVRAVRAFPALPTVTTTTATSITSSTATSGGDVTSAGDYPVTARGVCWSTTTGPTTSLPTKTTDGTGPGTFTSTITGLAASTLYYVRAYATSSVGTSYGNEVSFTTVSGSLAIGDPYQGGIIAYKLQPGDPGYISGQTHGLIAATANQSAGIAWITDGDAQATQIGNTSTAYGTGQANTNNMMNFSYYRGGAAKVCNDYTNTETGTGVYSDWYLPSRDELAKLYAMKVLGFGGFASSIYWSSSEIGSNVAWNQSFVDGSQPGDFKSSTHYVRAVRAF